MQKKDIQKIKICEECTNEFIPFPYKFKLVKYCCRECYLNSKKQKPQVCKQCSKEYYRDRKSKYCSRQCYYKNVTPPPLMIKTGKNHPGIRSRMNKLGLNWNEYNNWKKDKNRYYKEVWRITNQQNISIIENSDKLRARAGIKGGYQLDHIISISKGWKMKINPYIIGDISNLQFITWEENLKKQGK
jgi:hypothetical protein